MKKQLLLAFASFLLSTQALAEIYKHVDENGRVTYSNIKSKGATRLELDPDANNIPSNKGAGSGASKRTPTPSSFPRVDANTQSQRDGKRKEILQNELASEKAALDEAKKAYAEGEANPEVFKGANGQTFRNVPKFEEKMKGLKANLDNHQKNVELLQKEIDALR